jgi:hypothetical protein
MMFMLQMKMQTFLRALIISNQMRKLRNIGHLLE